MSTKNLHHLAAVFLIMLVLVDATYALTSCTEARESAALNTLEPGAQAPGFTLSDTSGSQRSLADFKDKVVVLEWINFDCPFVQKHYKSGNMQKLQKTYTEKGVIWLCINSSAEGRQGNYAPEKVNELIRERGAAPSYYLLDASGEVGRKYGARTTPHMFVIDRAGKIAYAGAIDDKPGVDEAEIDSAHSYVRAALDSVLEGKPVEKPSTKSYGCSVKYE